MSKAQSDKVLPIVIATSQIIPKLTKKDTLVYSLEILSSVEALKAAMCS